MKKLVFVALGAVLAVTVTASDRRVDDSSVLASVDARAAVTAPAGIGMVAHLDPSTGLPAEPGPDAMSELLAAQQFNQSAEGLVETASSVAGGGVVVDLQGRFQNSMMVTADLAGTTHTTCVSVPPVAQAPAAGEVK